MTNTIVIATNVSKCDDCPSINHKSYLAKTTVKNKKTPYRAKRRYFCGINNQKLIGHTKRVPDTCPRLKHGDLVIKGEIH